MKLNEYLINKSPVAKLLLCMHIVKLQLPQRPVALSLKPIFLCMDPAQFLLPPLNQNPNPPLPPISNLLYYTPVKLF